MWKLSIGALALAAAVSAPAAGAQSVLGVKGGVAFGNISNQGLLPGSLSNRTGFTGGITTGAQLGLFGVGVDALYAQRGATSSSTTATADTRLDYIDVPVYLTLTVPSIAIRPFVYAGPQASFEVRCRASNGTACSNPDRPRTDYAAVAGGGVHLGSSLSLEGRYVYGLRDLKLGTVTSGESYKNRTFMLLLTLGR